MKALKSQSVQTLIIGLVLCCLTSYFIKETTIATIFAYAFVAIVTGDKIRSNITAKNGQYYDEKEKSLKTAKDD